MHYDNRAVCKPNRAARGDLLDSGSNQLIIDVGALDAPVRRALGRDNAKITDWDLQTLHHSGNPTTDSVYRVTGSAVCADHTLPWTVVLKVIHAADGHTEPGSLGYWRREPFVYESGVLDLLPAGLAAPACLRLDAPEAGMVWLWLEAIDIAGDTLWPLARYGLAARHLGRFNGTYAADAARPSFPWLGRDYLCGWAALGADGIARLPAALDHPLVGRVYPGPIATQLRHLWEGRDDLLRLLAALPQTFCHMDALRRNLIARRDGQGRDQTVLIDWGEAGIGALGEDLAAFVTGSVFLDPTTPPARAVDAVAWAGYIEGLHDVGWHGNVDLVRQGYATAAALRILGGTTWVLHVAMDEAHHPEVAQAFEQPIYELLDRWAEAIQVVVEGLDQSRH